ncbi:MAG TPA: valine--tRNA ligase [Gemmatimonadaceae bacterium]|nr:valine--tRNA ligase [Gemmatimonadaceae bacterium]
MGSNNDSDFPPQFEPAAVEGATYAAWMGAELFHARAERSSREGGPRTPFVIVMPPPNVTGVLHMGHGLNNTVQDVLIRWRRMAGDEALWVPGTDHAGIATQNVVEKQLAKEGLTRFDVGRQAFVERTREWVSRTGGTILQQLRAIGASADWSRTAYTLDAGLSRAVMEAFVRLHEDGLIYRGHRVIHWCPRCLTSLSDEEAEHEDTTGSLYHISYPLANGVRRGGIPERSITVATTRPETMLGDVAVAVHPDDERYRELVGQQVMLPIADIAIPIIADAYTDPAFGSGAVKITPAHDANDFEVGVRHHLPMPVVISPTGVMEEGTDGDGRIPGALRGLDRFAARERIVEELRARGRLEKVETHHHSLRHCYRCDTVVEPRLSDQWFVRMKPLAEPALEAVRTGRIRILPERWEAVYVNWLENIRDWNISRQLWWGHRIPVWYCDGCGTMSVRAEAPDPTQCASCGGALRQDDDVLDTWFSSWLWPFSTLGWPDTESRDLRAFYPTDVLVTAPEILFFWVARMVMAGFRFMGEAPFHTVYLTGTARDTNHVRMQKSLGNGIDPLDVVQLYGADALRYTVVSALGLGTDLILDPADLERSFAPGRNFATKLWNIGRFLLTNVGGDAVGPLSAIAPERLTRADHWILARLDVAIAECDAALGPPRRSGDRWDPALTRSGLRLSEYIEAARRFVWNELADWYVETTKARLTAGDRDVARAVLVHAFDGALRLLHPVVPFITESLWQRLPGRLEGELLAAARWPSAGTPHTEAYREFDLAREVVGAIRQIRAEYDIGPGRSIDAVVVPSTPTVERVFSEEAALIGRLAKVELRVTPTAPTEAAAHALLTDASEVIVPLAGAIDVGRECGRLRTELSQLDKQLVSLRERLANEQFTNRAPKNVVDGEREKEREWSARQEQLRNKVKSLCGG